MGSDTGNSGGFSGIDPEQLSRTIHSLNRDQGRLKSSATSLKSRFQQYGVDTKPLTELMSIAGWAENQLPMLRRRHHLSVAEDEKYGHGYAGMVRIDESKVGQTKQARANGKKLGTEFKNRLDDGDKITPEMFADLRANKADADYVKSFYTALGSQGLAWVTKQLNDTESGAYKDHPDQLEKDQKAIFDTFGTYTQVAFEGKPAKVRRRAWERWLDDFKADEGPGFRPDWLAPLLKRDAQDDEFLMTFDARADEEVFVRRHREAYSDWLVRVEAQYLAKVPGFKDVGEKDIEKSLSILSDVTTTIKIGGITSAAMLGMGTVSFKNSWYNGLLRNAVDSTWWERGGTARTRASAFLRRIPPGELRSLAAPGSWLPGQLGNAFTRSSLYQSASRVPFTAGVRATWLGTGWDRVRGLPVMRSPFVNRGINSLVGSDALAMRYGGTTSSGALVTRAGQASLFKVARSASYFQKLNNARPAVIAAGKTASPLLKGLGAASKAGGFIRVAGVGASALATGVSAANVWSQGNPVDAFKKKGAGYVADVAEVGFNASLTAAMVAPNPVTVGLAIGTGLVYGGAKVVEHWDDIKEGWNKGVDAVGDTASAVVKDPIGSAKSFAKKANPVNWF